MKVESIKPIEPVKTVNKRKPGSLVRNPGKARPKNASEVEKYAREIGFELDGSYFIDYYQVTGWKYGKSRVPIKDWKACVRIWKRNSEEWAKNGEEDVFDINKLRTRC